jgi:hypothetical protein
MHARIRGVLQLARQIDAFLRFNHHLQGPAGGRASAHCGRFGGIYALALAQRACAAGTSRAPAAAAANGTAGLTLSDIDAEIAAARRARRRK